MLQRPTRRKAYYIAFFLSRNFTSMAGFAGNIDSASAKHTWDTAVAALYTPFSRVQSSAHEMYKPCPAAPGFPAACGPSPPWHWHQSTRAALPRDKYEYPPAGLACPGKRERRSWPFWCPLPAAASASPWLRPEEAYSRSRAPGGLAFAGFPRAPA